MQHDKVRGKKSKRRNERGVALITTLLLLMLLTGLSLTMVWSARSDMLINGYYRNFRGSFYAADSGLNIVRKAMEEQMQPGVAFPATWAANKQPIPPGTEGTVAATITGSYGAYSNVTGTGKGQAAGSWPGKFKVTSFTLSAPTCGGVACADPVGVVPQYIYLYNYSITAEGVSQGGEKATLFDRGQLQVTANIVAASSKTSFAAWGMFIDTDTICDGSTLVAGTISGPVFTNGSWNFGTGKYTFTDSVGSAGAKAGYQNGACQQVAGPSGNGITPTFNKGLNLNQPAVPLPTNDFNQQRAVLDGKGTAGQPSQSDLNSILRDPKGTAYPSSGTPSTGVFLPYSVDGSGNRTFTGGGVMVQGDATVMMQPTGTAGQQYTITQGTGSSAVTTVIVIDPTANGGKGSTTMAVTLPGKTTLVAQPPITGVPQMFDPATGMDLGYDTMLYVNGNITGLSGPAPGSPAIQDHTAVTVTAANNVSITGDILYKQEPVTLTATTDSKGNSIPADQLIPANDTGQALGIFTAKGNIQLNNSQASGNLEIDASLATISQGGTGGLVNPGAKINTLTIVGGRIQNTIQNINTTTRNVLFDRRFGNGFAPPWFPSTSVSLGSLKSADVTTVVTRLQWQNQTAYY